MTIGLKKKALGLLLSALPSAVFAESGISIAHDVSALVTSEGKTAVTLDITVLNSGSATFEDASIRFTGPVTPTDASAATVALGTLPATQEQSIVMDFVVDGDAQMESLFSGELYFSFSGINEAGESVTLDVNSAGSSL